MSVSRTRIFELVSRGELRSFKIGRLRRIVASSLGDYIAREAD